jgi:choline-sulfatase
MDKLIGNIIEVLADKKLLDNTIIIYTSDHGEQLGENGLWWKQTFYENSVKVPAIISWPDGLPSDQSIDSVINQYDLIATMLDATNSKKLPRSNGKSLMEHIKNPKSKWKNLAFSEYCMDDSDFGAFSGNLGGEDIHAKSGGVQNRMVRSDNWKLIYYHGYESELFDLDKDPYEKNNLSSDKKYLNIKENLEKLVLKDWNPTSIAKKMRILKQEQKLQFDWANQTDPDDTLRWDLDPKRDSTRLDSIN